MEWNALKGVLSGAISEFLADSDVRGHLMRTTNERSLFAPFAEHLQAALASYQDDQADYGKVPEYQIVCEYNRSPDNDPKRALVPAYNRIGGVETLVRPNVIIHVPGTNTHNLLVIELSKTRSQVPRLVLDIRKKMVSYVEYDIRYEFALSLLFSSDPENGLVEAILLRLERYCQLAGSQQLDLRRRMGFCDKIILASGKRSTYETVEPEMSEIQSTMGFEDVTNELQPESVIDKGRGPFLFPIFH